MSKFKIFNKAMVTLLTEEINRQEFHLKKSLEEREMFIEREARGDFTTRQNDKTYLRRKEFVMKRPDEKMEDIKILTGFLKYFEKHKYHMNIDTFFERES